MCIIDWHVCLRLYHEMRVCQVLSSTSVACRLGFCTVCDIVVTGPERINRKHLEVHAQINGGTVAVRQPEGWHQRSSTIVSGEGTAGSGGVFLLVSMPRSVLLMRERCDYHQHRCDQRQLRRRRTARQAKAIPPADAPNQFGGEGESGDSLSSMRQQKPPRTSAGSGRLPLNHYMLCSVSRTGFEPVTY
jgi:hypothetical protein